MNCEAAPQNTASAALIEFRPSGIHGTGGFATTLILKGARVIEYVGEKINKQESMRRCELDNQYIFDLDDDWDLDGDVSWNPARHINHSCAPNCEAVIADDGRVWIEAIRDIASREEVTFNYNYDLEDYRDHPCRCGTPQCVGYIVAEDHFEHLRGLAALQA
jgi:uncharacterized protein